MPFRTGNIISENHLRTGMGLSKFMVTDSIVVGNCTSVVAAIPQMGICDKVGIFERLQSG